MIIRLKVYLKVVEKYYFKMDSNYLVLLIYYVLIILVQCNVRLNNKKKIWLKLDNNKCLLGYLRLSQVTPKPQTLNPKAIDNNKCLFGCLRLSQVTPKA